MQIKTKTHHSVGKALEIIKSYIPNNRERSTVGLARDLKINVSTVSRMLGVLTVHGFLKQNPNTKRYSLGKIALDLGKTLHKSISEQIVIIAKPHVDNLRDLLGVDIALEVLVGKETVLAYRAWGPRPFKMRFSVGENLAVHVAAGARIIMAFSPPEVVDDMLKGKLERLTPKTIVNKDILKKKFIEFKRLGVSFDIGETDLDFTHIAAPIFNYEHNPIAAVVIGESTRKVKGAFKKKAIAGLKETAAAISSDLFYQEDIN
jgi:DNA-binding IclR family transcriptional regulator